MKEIPVGATVAHAYRFAFFDFPKILGLIWLPAVLISVISIYPMRRLINIFETLSTEQSAAALHQAWILIPFLILGFILYCSQIASIVQLALQPARQQVLYHISLGKTVWRLIGAFLLVILVYLGAWLASMLVGILVSLLFSPFVTAANLKIALAITSLIAGVLVYGAFIAVTVRPVFLMAPVVIAEQKISIGRAWSLSRGNFWRLMLIFVAVFLPFWLIQRLLLVAFLPKNVMLAAPPGASQEVKAAVLANVMNWAAQMLGTMLHYWYITYPLGLVWMVIYLGTIFGAQTFAYRALTEDETSVPVATD